MVDSNRPSTADGETGEIDVFAYHQRSKHRLDGYARGPESIDWDLQPDPFRRFEGAPLIELPLTQGREQSDPPLWHRTVEINDLFEPDRLPVAAVTLKTLAVWLEHALALSAWKQYGTARWSLRCNPSSGNLHPTEAYLIVAGVEGLPDGVYHYRADLHALETRCVFAEPVRVLSPQLFVGLSSVHWREAWKYGERAYRYCQLDIGHAVAALSYAASLNGWSVIPQAIADQALAVLLGTGRRDDFIDNEAEWADGLLHIRFADSDQPQSTNRVLPSLMAAAGSGQWLGRAAVIDRRHFYNWPAVAAVAQQVRRPPESVVLNADANPWPAALPGDYQAGLGRLIRQRRSAQAFDGNTVMSAAAFFVLLDHLLPRRGVAPWAALPAPANIHVVFFIHRVEGLVPGLYALPRSEEGEVVLRGQLREQFAWQKVEQAPAHLPFYHLIQAKAERTAAKLCCQQAIAGDSAFSLAMIAEFSTQVESAPWRYRELFWEAGALGQVLYLEAEGIGLRGTGIGCFFDDAVHELLGIEGQMLQSLYHFTVGGALQDHRIVSYPPYGERRQRT